jgi:type VI secretion system secreted protein Hcp
MFVQPLHRAVRATRIHTGLRLTRDGPNSLREEHMSDSNKTKRLVGRPLLAGALAAAGVSAALPASADTFLFLENVPGETADEKHKDWIDILSYTQTFRNSGSTTGGAAGKVTCGDITILKGIDKSSPKLLEAVVKGDFVKQGKMDFTSVGGKEGNRTYYFVTMEELQVIAVEQTDQPDDARIVERVTLRGSKFSYEYTTQRADGSAGDKVRFAVDCKTFKF